jgi:hypothetical protein
MKKYLFILLTCQSLLPVYKFEIKNILALFSYINVKTGKNDTNQNNLPLSEKVEAAKIYFSYASTALNIENLEKIVDYLALEKKTDSFKIQKNSIEVGQFVLGAGILCSCINIMVEAFKTKEYPESELLKNLIKFGFLLELFNNINKIKSIVLYHDLEDKFENVARLAWAAKDSKWVIDELILQAKIEPEAPWVKNFNNYLKCYNRFNDLVD